ncbi:hypothetical protein F5883DRAFT_192632 [Diaporthe sp. PMI_573]|nr:hypothetical protein F5883DRAFT_192632 [Diaporthaceae sp. PMI_573]
MGNLILHKVCTGIAKRRDVYCDYKDIRRPGQELLAMQVLITGPSTGSSSTTEEASTANTGSITSATSTSQDASSSTTSSSTTAAHSSGGLSTGAAAGIGAGAGVAGLLLVLGGWLLYRRGVARGRQSGARSEQAKLAQYERIVPPQQPHNNYNNRAYQTHELEPAPPRPIELEPTAPRPRELE